MSFHANKIATRLAWKLGPEYCDEKALGTVVSEAIFRLPLEGRRTSKPATGRRVRLVPALAERQAGVAPRQRLGRGARFAIEVVSPTTRPKTSWTRSASTSRPACGKCGLYTRDHVWCKSYDSQQTVRAVARLRRTRNWRHSAGLSTTPP